MLDYTIRVFVRKSHPARKDRFLFSTVSCLIVVILRVFQTFASRGRIGKITARRVASDASFGVFNAEIYADRETDDNQCDNPFHFIFRPTALLILTRGFLHLFGIERRRFAFELLSFF